MQTAIHNKAGFTHALEILMESFTRAVAFVLIEGERLDATDYRLSNDFWAMAVRNCGYVQARVATSRLVSELSDAG